MEKVCWKIISEVKGSTTWYDVGQMADGIKG